MCVIITFGVGAILVFPKLELGLNNSFSCCCILEVQSSAPAQSGPINLVEMSVAL